MNDLGLTLAWVAVQVALVLGPALALQAWAARRGPAAGAWLAAISLGLVVALQAWTFLPMANFVEPAPASAATRVRAEARAATTPSAVAAGNTSAPTGPRLNLAALARAWARIERGAAAPAARCRPWAGTVGILVLAATGLGLCHLALGLWGVRLCLRKSNLVDDPALTGLLDELRAAMGYRRAVSLCVVDDLTTPATAGWRRPVILLPRDWRSWDEGERRAVLAHELAHVVRGDYAAGLVARLALAFHPFHPLVHWMAGRLQLQQELAADALGARYAGGKARYLVALSRLALEQDGRSPHWPARAFLPGRGALIRRIAMLRDERRTGTDGRGWRIVAAAALFGLTIAVALLRGPARSAAEEPSAPTKTRQSAFPKRSFADVTGEAAHGASSGQTEKKPDAPLYIRGGMDGVIVIRPAALAQRAGMTVLVPFVDLLQAELADLAKELHVDTSRPGFLKLSVTDIDWVTGSLGFRNDPKTKLHQLMMGSPVVHTVAPFDWLAFLRQWGCELEEVRMEKGVYYKVNGPLAKIFGPNPSGVYLPDDRTVVLDEETRIRKLVGVPPEVPGYLRYADWEGARHGLVAVALNNADGTFAKRYDLGRPDDALVLPLFQGVERWVFSVADSDALTLHATAACSNRPAREALAHAVESLCKLGKDALASAPPPDGDAAEDPVWRMANAFLANLTILQADDVQMEGFPRMVNVVTVKATGFGTLADYAAILQADAAAQKAGKKDEPERVKR